MIEWASDSKWCRWPTVRRQHYFQFQFPRTQVLLDRRRVFSKLIVTLDWPLHNPYYRLENFQLISWIQLIFSSISADFSNFSWFFPELSVNIRQKKKKSLCFRYHGQKNLTRKVDSKFYFILKFYFLVQRCHNVVVLTVPSQHLLAFQKRVTSKPDLYSRKISR